jgi:membrane-bound inhibitor of C-type lysozyme
MANVNPDIYHAVLDQKARLSDLEVTGTLYAATITQSGNQTITGTLDVTGVLGADGGVQFPIQVISGDGAITIKSGYVFLTKGSAAAITLAAPTAVTDDGKEICIIAASAQAHVVTVTGAAGGAGQDVGTFGGAINDSTRLVARNALWYIAGAPRNVTWA